MLYSIQGCSTFPQYFSNRKTPESWWRLVKLTLSPGQNKEETIKSSSGSAQPTSFSKWQVIRRLALVAGAYFLLAGLLTWPLLLHLNDSVPGTPYQDQDQNLWNYWWLRFSLFKLHTNPFHTDYLFAPYGTDLYLNTLNLTGGILSLPLQVFGLLAAYNLVGLIALALTGLATYLLASEILESGTSAFVAGALMTFMPIHLHHINGAQYEELISLTWLLFYAWLLMKMRRASSFKWPYALAGALLLAMVAYSSYYQLMSVGILSLLALLWHAKDKPPNLKSYALNWLSGWLGFTVLFSPIIIGITQQLKHDADQAQATLDYVINNSLDLFRLVIPRDTTTMLGRLVGNEGQSFHASDNMFVGYELLALAVAGLFFFFYLGKAKRPPQLGFWLIAGTVFLIIALGPELVWNEQPTDLPLPYRLITDLPFGKIARDPSHLANIALLALTLLAGLALQQLLTLLPRPRRFALVSLLAIGLAFEYWALPYPLTTMQIPAGYSSLQGSGAVLDLPMPRRNIQYSKYMFYQTAHQRPILRAYLSRDFATIYADPDSPLTPFQNFKAEPDIFEPAVSDRLSDLLRLQGIGTVVLNRSELADQAATAEKFLIQAIGIEPYQRDEQRSFFQVPPGPARPAILRSSGWYDLELRDGKLPTRWMGQEAQLVIVMPQAATVSLEMQAVAFAQPYHLAVLVDNQEVTRLSVSTQPQKLTVTNLPLKAGVNRVSLVAQEAPVSPQALGKGNDRRELSVQMWQIKLLADQG
jgi:hypothetical protein